MSEKMKDGGQAFPVPDCGHGVPIYEGMTLRDYFAAKALQGVLANPTFIPESDIARLSALCYEQADAMLAAREVTK